MMFRTLAFVLLSVPAFAGDKPTDSFRNEHVEVRAHLGHARDWAGALASQQPAAQRETARKVVAFFEEHIKPHAEWEERVLYPLVDRLAGSSGEHRFTATMRYEHRIVGEWTGELSRELAKAKPDFRAFARRADNLIGLVTAHFDEEEQVLLPVVDKAMTKEQFEKETKVAEEHR